MKLISPESLNDTQRETLAGYSRFFPHGAVCVNVMLGVDPWDIRPLLLMGGKVHLCRFSMKLDEAQARAVADELAGFSVLLHNGQKTQMVPGEGRVMSIRPYEPATLSEDLERGVIVGQQALSGIVRKLIQLVSELSRRSIAHGHISPANIALVQGEVVLLDPVVGALHRTSDVFLAPESEVGKTPEPPADLYSLGRIIKILLGDSLTSRQAATVEQLLLPSPKQRPPLVEVAVAFGAQDVMSAEESEAGVNRPGEGRVVRPGAAPRRPRVPAAQTSPTAGGDNEGTSTSYASRIMAGLLVALVVAGWVVKDRNPELYYQFASYIPFLAPAHSVEYEADWASEERGRMAVVARAAVLRKEPAAINTIISDVSSGSNPQGVKAPFLRVALSELWRDELSPSDIHAALAWGLSGLVPEGGPRATDLASLHPGVLLALIGQGQYNEQRAALQKIPVSVLSKLADPFGPLFVQLEGMGVKTLGDDRAIGFARIVCGDMSAQAIHSFIGENTPAPLVLAKVTTVLPVMSASPAGVNELVGVLKELGGDVGALLGWFDLVDIAHWSDVPAVDKLRLILGVTPEPNLKTSQWADLLVFPLSGVRAKAMDHCKGFFADGDGDRLVLTLSSPGLDLTREEIVALVSALQLPPDKRADFVTAWYELKPSPDAVLLVLLARSSVHGNDLFNLEAARYLRKTTWKASVDELRLLVEHPEPLARAVGYGRLDPAKQEERQVLTARKGKESDPGCLKVLDERLK